MYAYYPIPNMFICNLNNSNNKTSIKELTLILLILNSDIVVCKNSSFLFYTINN